MKIFDPAHLDKNIILTPDEIRDTIPDPLGVNREFITRPHFLQRMGIRDDGTMGHLNMLDADYEFNRRPKSTEEICGWYKKKLLVLVITSDFELVCHGGVIEPTIQQVRKIISGEQDGLKDPYLPDEYPGSWLLDGNYFFSAKTGNGKKFLDYLK